MIKKTLLFFLLIPALSAAIATQGFAQDRGKSIVDTPHNLSISGGGGEHAVKSTVEGRICVFCHVPHKATAITPLWSREPSNLLYTLYQSTTMGAAPEQPKGASRLCLSCHDGTIALGLAAGVNLDESLGQMPQDIDPRKNPNLGTDLSDDHPISFVYPVDAELHDPATLLMNGVRLDAQGYVECTGCHDPHNNEYGKFLIVNSDAQHDALCTICHDKAGWDDPDSTHRTGGTRYPSIIAEVAADGCMNCHLPHNAPGAISLLTSAAEEDVCFTSCHSDVQAKFSQIYHHPLEASSSAHTPTEQLPVVAGNKHVECVDCHNPHQAGAAGTPLGAAVPEIPPASTAPFVSGALRGVRVDAAGSAAQYEYEICFKCHAGGSADDFVSITATRPSRVLSAYDESIRFASGNPSYHPVTTDRTGTGRSLLLEYQVSMQRIYCSDCHDPHGSSEAFSLKGANWDTVPSGTTDYPLCFRCHDPDFLLLPSSTLDPGILGLHRSHVVDHSSKTPCSACHDPHGVPGGTTTNGAHLINFDTRYAGPSPVYDSFARSCSVNSVDCHPDATPRSY